ncbi:MAG: ATP-dependent RNA helicase DbpA [Bdellovibrionota bacterium]
MIKLLPEIQNVLNELGFTQLTPIQEASLPILLNDKDFVGQSQTGSGKTAAFVIPILQKLKLNVRGVQALILCPTRELSTQVVREFRRFGRGFAGLHVLTLVGGVPSRPQREALEQGAHILVGTPGRILDFIQKDRLDFSILKTLVLDEADKMLDMGFEEDIRAIIDATPGTRQTVFFSATFPVGIENLSRKYQIAPEKVVIADTDSTIPMIEQIVYKSDDKEKVQTLLRVLQQHPAQSVLIFCNQKKTVSEVGESLLSQGTKCGLLHGDLEQKDRDRTITLFRNGSYRFLVATDVAARGLDIESVELVINFDLPLQAEIYTHRIGRTGRAGRSGTAVSIMLPQEEIKILEIERLASVKMERKNLGFKNQFGLGAGFQGSAMETICLFAGRKDKLRPGDILGALTGEAGGLAAKDVGKIEIYDTISYVAVSSQVSRQVFARLRDGKIKGKKIQIKMA